MKFFRPSVLLFIFTFIFSLHSQSSNIVLSTDSIKVNAFFETSVTDSFSIRNTGDTDLNYSLLDFSGLAIAIFILHENDFSTFPGTDYTNSNWTSVSGGAQVAGKDVTAILTSPQFSTEDYDEFYLQFDQNFYYQPGSYSKVEYNNGSGWTEVYFQNADTTTAHQRIILTPGPTGQLRFTGFTTKVSGNTAFWLIDNIEVGGSIVVAYHDCPWLTINSSLEGVVAPSDSAMISFTCNAVGLSVDSHFAEIRIASNDPDDPEMLISVHFDVILGIPSNINTYIENDLIHISWNESPGAESYDVYYAFEPYGPFTYYYNTPLTSFSTSTWYPKIFFYIVAKSD